jgi:dynein assembly factor with WDR repeat domains 1
MKLKRFHLRYNPPGIILEYLRKNGEIETKSIDLLNLTPETDIDRLIDQILLEEPLISENRKPQLKKLIESILFFKLPFHYRTNRKAVRKLRAKIFFV